MTSPIVGVSGFAGFVSSLFNGSATTGRTPAPISGADSRVLVSQMLQAQARPGTLLKARLSGVQAGAAAYRDVGSAFATLQNTASALTDPAPWAAGAAGADTLSTAVQSLVTAANDVLTRIAGHTGTDGALPGDGTLTTLAGQVRNAVTTAVNGGGSAAAAGLQVTSDGLLSFDATAFTAALTANPSLVQNTFAGSVSNGADGLSGTVDDAVTADGLGARLAALAAQAGDSVNGTLTRLATGQDTLAGNLRTQADSWDATLQDRQQSLTRQFALLNQTLGELQSQSSWLHAAIQSPSTSSSSTTAASASSSAKPAQSK